MFGDYPNIIHFFPEDLGLSGLDLYKNVIKEQPHDEIDASNQIDIFKDTLEWTQNLFFQLVFFK